MAKFNGKLGYRADVEQVDGISTESILEINVRGDLLSRSSKAEAREELIDDFVLDHRISIMWGKRVNPAFEDIRYITYHGTKWKVDSVQVEYPRLILSTGGVWNG